MKPLSQNEPWLTWIDNLGLLAAKALPFLIDKLVLPVNCV